MDARCHVNSACGLRRPYHDTGRPRPTQTTVGASKPPGPRSRAAGLSLACPQKDHLAKKRIISGTGIAMAN